MKRLKTFYCIILLHLVGIGWVNAQEMPRVQMETSFGTIVIELDTAKAPGTVENFIAYVKQGFYDGTVFHRIIPGFMIQGGGFTKDLKEKETQAPVKNEANNGLKNVRGSIAMARTSDPHSATAQFFINVVDNSSLNHRSETPPGWGYAVFGTVVEGMGVVDTIKAVPTGSTPPFSRDVPTQPVIIKRATLISTDESADKSTDEENNNEEKQQ